METLQCSQCGENKPLTEYAGKKYDRPPKPGDMCKACRAQAQALGRATASAGRTYKTPDHVREAQRQRMKQARTYDPTYGQPRVNRRTLAYCEHCHEVMPWGDTVGSVKEKKDLTCPKCKGVLRTLVRAPPAGKVAYHTGVAFCIECLHELYWHQAAKRTIKGRKMYVCPDCQTPLYAIREQLTGQRGGNMKEKEKEKEKTNTIQEELQ